MTVTTGVRARLYVDQALDAGRSVDLGANQSHYLKHVLRLGPGVEVALFNGKDGEWQAVSKPFAGMPARWVETQLRPQIMEPDLWLRTTIKRARLDACAESGRTWRLRLVPVLTERTEVKQRTQIGMNQI